MIIPDDLSFEQTIELEKNIKIKNEAVKLYNQFLKNYKMAICDYIPKDKRTKIWSDDHNATYIYMGNEEFVFQCRFLHERYDVPITPQGIFERIKNNYRGISHFKSFIDSITKGNKND